MSEIDRSRLSEKQRIELAAAEAFLPQYNELKGTSFEVVDVADAPDIECIDNVSGQALSIEVTLLEDRQADVGYMLGRVKVDDEFSQTRVIDFKSDVIPRLRERLGAKLQSDFGAATVLLIKQVSPLWTVNDWRREASEVVLKALEGREKYYGKGVWILCRNLDANSAANDLCALYDPEVGVIQPPTAPPVIQGLDGVVAKMSWERNILPDFLEFSKRDDVDPVIRIDSPHGCDFALLITFLKSEPEEERQRAIDFYKAQMNIVCICGRGTARALGNWIAL